MASRPLSFSRCARGWRGHASRWWQAADWGAMALASTERREGKRERVGLTIGPKGRTLLGKHRKKESEPLGVSCAKMD
jgi:hypothetical protein